MIGLRPWSGQFDLRKQVALLAVTENKSNIARHCAIALTISL